MIKSIFKTYKCFSLFLLLNIAGCSPEVIQVQKPKVMVQKPDYILDVGRTVKGASISLKVISRSPVDGYSTKAGSNGIPAKKASDVHHFVIYLCTDSHPAGFTTGSNPLSTVSGGSFNVYNGGAATRTVMFSNVPASGTNYYYAVVQAQDVANNDLIKPNSGFLGSPRLAVSALGVKVNADMTLTDLNNLTVTAELDDATGASIEASLGYNSGSSIVPAITGTSLGINILGKLSK
jgi:hypothetical protein